MTTHQAIESLRQSAHYYFVDQSFLLDAEQIYFLATRLHSLIERQTQKLIYYIEERNYLMMEEVLAQIQFYCAHLQLLASGDFLLLMDELEEELLEQTGIDVGKAIIEFENRLKQETLNGQ